MKKITFIIVLSVLISACNSTKRVQKSISNGDYDQAIELSVKKLRKSTTSKKKQKHILLLEEAYAKAVKADLRNLERLKKDTNSTNFESIFETYNAMDKRQELIRPLLPLFHKDENKNIDFFFVNYTDELNASKASLSDYLYANANNLLLKSTKADARKAYTDLEYLERINPNFKNVDDLLDQAHLKGTDYVRVKLENQTNQIIPRRLEEDLLNFNTYGLDQFWTVFHSQEQNKSYDYELKLLFHRIDVSPEILNEKQYLLTKEIKDGFEYKLDANGNVLRDSLGNGIKVDKFIKITSDFFEIHQEKATHIAGDVVFSEIKNGNNRIIERFPIESEFIFIHDFGEMSGDKRALDNFHLDLIRKREVPFPTSEQMIFDTGEDLKAKLKSIIEDLEI